MKIVSFNTNGIRARAHQLDKLVDEQQPDIIAIQETKVQDQDFPLETVEALGYRTHYFGQKTHYGVALLSKRPPLEVQKGFPGDGDEAQRRFIMGVYETADGQRDDRVLHRHPGHERQQHEADDDADDDDDAASGRPASGRLTTAVREGVENGAGSPPVQAPLCELRKLW